jgi:hypothetical protein
MSLSRLRKQGTVEKERRYDEYRLVRRVRLVRRGREGAAATEASIGSWGNWKVIIDWTCKVGSALRTVPL